jgi:hypothetical protein
MQRTEQIETIGPSADENSVPPVDLNVDMNVDKNVDSGCGRGLYAD